MESNITQQLRDIKPLLEIPDNSYYIYWGLIIFAGLLALVIVLFVIKKLWDNKKVNLAKGYLEAIKKIDWVDSKKSAYDATHYARLLATDDRLKELFLQLEPLLEAYKYKKVVDDIDQDTKNTFNDYVRVVDERI